MEEIAIYNSSGMLMKQVRVSGQEARVDIGDLKSGVYYLTLELNNNTPSHSQQP